MRILMVHNDYARRSGEESVVEFQVDLLLTRGHEVSQFRRSSESVRGSLAAKSYAFFSGIHNPLEKRRFTRVLRHERPDIVHIHNLYPLISPSILRASVEQDIPIVMTVHNYRLVCPNGLFYTNGRVCEECGTRNEFACLRNRCEGSYLKSLGYALRGASARIGRQFLDNVSVFAALTSFQRGKLIEYGFPPDRVRVLPNCVSSSDDASDDVGQYIGYVGRLSEEKGLDVLLAAAATQPNVPFRIAGSGPLEERLRRGAPANVEFDGELPRERVRAFIRNARCLVVCSRWYEGLPMVILEAFSEARPVIVAELGAMPELVAIGPAGLTFNSGDSAELAARIALLWGDHSLSRRLGNSARQVAESCFGVENYYRCLMEVYADARDLCPAPAWLS